MTQDEKSFCENYLKEYSFSYNNVNLGGMKIFRSASYIDDNSLTLNVRVDFKDKFGSSRKIEHFIEINFLIKEHKILLRNDVLDESNYKFILKFLTNTKFIITDSNNIVHPEWRYEPKFFKILDIIVFYKKYVGNAKAKIAMDEKEELKKDVISMIEKNPSLYNKYSELDFVKEKFKSLDKSDEYGLFEHILNYKNFITL